MTNWILRPKRCILEKYKYILFLIRDDITPVYIFRSIGNTNVFTEKIMDSCEVSELDWTSCLGQK